MFRNEIRNSHHQWLSSVVVVCRRKGVVKGRCGGGALAFERVRWRSRFAPDVHTFDIRNMFLFVGADPATGWLAVGDVRSGSVKRVASGVGEGADVGEVDFLCGTGS